MMPVAGTTARHITVHKNRRCDVLLNMIADVVLNGGIAIDVGANLRENLVPRAADLFVEVAAQGAKVFIQPFSIPTPAELHALSNR
jgi:hypothetical protein